MNNNEINFGCGACKYFVRGFSKLSGMSFIDGKPHPRIRTVQGKCTHNQEEFERWFNDNVWKPIGGYSKAPDCFVPNDGLQYVLDDLKRHSQDNTEDNSVN